MYKDRKHLLPHVVPLIKHVKEVRGGATRMVQLQKDEISF